MMKKTRTCNGNEGFTLIETLVALVLILFVFMGISRMVVYSFDHYKKSRLDLEMRQTLESRRDQLLGTAYSAPEMTEGNHTGAAGSYSLEWEIRHLSSTLKKVKLSISYKYKDSILTRHTYFYKSKFIHGKKG